MDLKQLRAQIKESLDRDKVRAMLEALGIGSIVTSYFAYDPTTARHWPLSGGMATSRTLAAAGEAIS